MRTRALLTLSRSFIEPKLNTNNNCIPSIFSLSTLSTAYFHFFSIDTNKRQYSTKADVNSILKTQAPPSSTTLQSLQGAEFHDRLEYLRESNSVLPYSTLLQEFQRSVPKATQEDATRICDALATSGSIIKDGSMVYLHPTQIVAAIRRILPMDIDALKTQLQQTESELAVLEEQYTAIRRKARFRSLVVNYAFFTAVAAQWGLLFRLTYWELSWDVIEPVGFFVGGVASLASFAWFLKTRQDFTFEAMHQRFMSGYEKKEFEKSNFDIRKYNQLKEEVDRLKDLLEAHEHSSSTGVGVGNNTMK